MIPCVRESCILYPVCITKQVIYCSKLHEYVKYELPESREIREQLPKIVAICDDEGNESIYPISLFVTKRKKFYAKNDPDYLDYIHRRNRILDTL